MMRYKNFFTLLALLLALSLALAAPGWATEVTFPNASYDTLKKAVEAAGENGTVTLTGNVELDETLGITCSVTINGNGYALDGKKQRQVFNIDTVGTVNISNLNITGGNVTNGNGGGVYVKDATVNLTNCSIYGNMVGGEGNIGYGGGLYAENATVTLTHCSIYGNMAKGNCGGGVHTYGSTTLNMINCTVTGNETKGGGNGGGVYADFKKDDSDKKLYPTVNMVNCTLANNISKNDSGGIVPGSEISATTLNAVNTVFWNETATKKYVSSNLDDSISRLNLYSCAYGPEAIDSKVIPHNECFKNLDWKDHTPMEVEVKVNDVTMKHRVFPLTDKDTNLINKGMAVSEITKIDGIQLSDKAEEALKKDQLGGDRDSKPDIGAVEFIHVTGVSVSPKEETITVGETLTLTATVSPGDATFKTMTWRSDNTEIATVDENGKVTGKSAGTATITVTATNGTDTTDDDKTATCTVTVESSLRAPAFDLKTVESLIRSFFEGWNGDIFIFPFGPDKAEVSGDRTVEDLVKALSPEQLAELSNDHSVILAVLPEITPKETAVFVLGVSLDITPEGVLKWHGNPRPAENSVALAADEGSEECLFLDDEGQETAEVPASGYVNAAVKLTKGNTYAPVITAETSTAPSSDKGSGGCDALSDGLLALALIPLFRKKQK